MDRKNYSVRALCRLGTAFALALLIPLTGCGRLASAPVSATPPDAGNPPARLQVLPCTAIAEADGPTLPATSDETSAGANAEAGDAKINEQPPQAEQPSLEPFELSAEDLAKNQSLASAKHSADAKNTPPQAEIVADEPGMLLPWGRTTPSSEMTAVAQRAEQAARRGFNLAQRGAMYSARAQFIESLRILAQALDEQRSTTSHTKALSAGLRAMDEVNDLVPRNNRLETDLNLKLILDAHRTPVLKEREIDKIAAAEAQRIYLTYAQEQLAAAAGDQAVASLALHGMGRICVAPVEMHGPREQIAEAKAVTFYQTALIVEPRNFLAANELGVLLTRYGRLPEAKAVFQQAASVSDAPTTWRNLAVVCERLGDSAKATKARHEADLAMNRLQGSGNAAAGMRYPIDWVAPEKFANSNSMVTAATSSTPSVMAPTPSPHPATASAAVAESSSTTAAKSPNSIWPWVRK